MTLIFFIIWRSEKNNKELHYYIASDNDNATDHATMTMDMHVRWLAVHSSVTAKKKDEFMVSRIESYREVVIVIKNTRYFSASLIDIFS